MRKIINSIFLTAFLLVVLSNCQEKPFLKGVISDKAVQITLANNGLEKGYYSLIVPIEFQVNLNLPEIKDVRVYYKSNQKMLNQPTEFVIRDAKTDKIIFGIEDLNYPYYPNSINIINREIIISEAEAKALLKKYNSNNTINNLLSKTDTIKLSSYSLFRKDQSDLMKSLKNRADTLILSVGKSKGQSEIIKKKIEW